MRVQPREPEVEEIQTGPWGALLLVAGVVALGWWAGLATVLIVLFILVCIFLHELGHYMTARAAGMKVTEFFIGFGPRLWSFHRGETEYGFKAIPAGAYVKIIGMSNLEDDIDPADEDRTYRAKPYWRRLSVGLAGSAMHFLIAIVLSFVILAGFGEERVLHDEWVVQQVSEDSPAAAAGLEPGDRVVSVDGETFDDFIALSEELRARPGDTVELGVLRDGEVVAIEVTLAEENPAGEQVGFLGIGPHIPVTPRQRVDPISAAGRSVGELGSTIKLSVTGLGRFFSPSGIEGYVNTLQGDSSAPSGEPDPDRITSIVGAVNITSQVAENDFVDALLVLVLLNVFIGVFNLIPLLPLDGGHVAIATYEKVREMVSGRRYRADVGKLLPLTYAVFMVLVVIGVTALWIDIVDPIKLPG